VADNAVKIDQLRQWKNNEVFNARDYVYERDTVVAAINQLIDYADYLDEKSYTKIWVQETEPTDEETSDIDLWYKIIP